MNTKKLIGMIIGLTLFAALIAGATFAWFTATAAIQNDSKDMTTRNFTFTSPTGTALGRPSASGTEALLQYIADQPARNKFAAGRDYIVLALSKAVDTPYASSVKIILKKAENTITLPYVVKYAVCRSATASQCNNSVSTAIPAAANNNTSLYSKDNWVVVPVSDPGTSTATYTGYVELGTGDQVLFEDIAASLNDTTSANNTKSPFRVTGAVTNVSYYVYFWLDPELVTSENVSSVAGKHIYGNVYFTATQGD